MTLMHTCNSSPSLSKISLKMKKSSRTYFSALLMGNGGMRAAVDEDCAAFRATIFPVVVLALLELSLGIGLLRMADGLERVSPCSVAAGVVPS